MPSFHRLRAPMRALAALALLTLGGCISFASEKPVEGLIHVGERTFDGAPAPQTVTAPVRLDNNRAFVELDFRRPDGSIRKALAWVNTGGGALVMAPSLHADLGPPGPIAFELAGMPVEVDSKAVLVAGPTTFDEAAGPLKVETMLPAGVLERFRVTIDYQARTLTLARPSDAPAPGTAVPIAVNPRTAMMSVAARIDGQAYPVVLDLGAGYTWMKGAVVRDWLGRHPDWRRTDGPAGESNQAMVGFALEQGGVTARVPAIELGGLRLGDVGVLGSSPANGSPIDRLVEHVFWTGWGKGAPEPVVGWIGGNVFRGYRLTIDYKNRVTYWLPIAEPRTDDLDSVGVSLVYTARGYVIGRLIRRDGAASVQGVRAGDRLAAVDGRKADAMTHGEVIGALHGAPGEHRRLTLERGGRRFDVDAVVSAY